MKKTLTKALLGLFVILMLGAASPQQAEAINIYLKNPHPHQLSAVIVYFEDKANKWVTQGWFNVTPNSTRTINLSNSTKRNFVYIYAHTSEGTWRGDGPGSITRTVIKERFKYYEGQNCPAGNNRRQVTLAKHYIENSGALHWKAQ